MPTQGHPTPCEAVPSLLVWGGTMGSTRPGDPGNRPRIENAVQHRTRLGLAALSLAALTTLAACGGQDESAADPASSGGTSTSASASPTPTPTPSAAKGEGRGSASAAPVPEADLAVEIAGDDISPNAAELEVGVGDSITVSVESDRAGELHVHSTPEQYVEFDAGETAQELTFTTPGTVEVEDHDTGDVVAFVDVR